MTDPHRTTILITIQSSLVGEIFLGIRRIDASWTGEVITLVYQMDPAFELDQNDMDSITTIESEMAAHLPEFEVVSEISRTGADVIREGAVCVFSRRMY